MKYNEFLNLLNKHNIKLFDYEKRISFHNIQNYKIISDNQIGGGNLNYLHHKSYNEIKNIINISLSPNHRYLFNLLN